MIIIIINYYYYYYYYKKQVIFNLFDYDTQKPNDYLLLKVVNMAAI